MSPTFQETLAGNEMLMNAQGEDCVCTTVNVTQRIFIQKSVIMTLSPSSTSPPRFSCTRTPIDIHFVMMMAVSAVKVSHTLAPLYTRVLIVLAGQQVTGYGHNDTNNFWTIVPTKALPETGRGRIVRHQDIVQLLHLNTQTLLLTHDVASPLMATNQEFTTWPKDDFARHNDTLFQVDLVDGDDGTPWKTKSGHFRLVHVPTRVAMWTHSKQLPEWAFKQQEINGNKNQQDRTTSWFVEEVIDTGTHHQP